VAILAFDVHQSNLPLQIAFPILVANLGNWLAPASPIETPDVAQETAALRPGMPVLVWPQIGVEQIVVRAPTGQEWRYAVEGGEPVPFGETHALGVYTVLQQRQDETTTAQFAVNLFSEVESAIGPRETIQVGAAPVVGEAQEALGRREWWRWPALAGLGVLVVEWVVYWRRSSL
jgi:hypothetical protein